ncbi:MAG: hypothetical protein HZA36_01995 [Parcubacteria group bacterium]|nr:hypothetical protein [Parcubacteria group bacterium]
MTRQQKIIVVVGTVLVIGIIGVFVLFFSTKKQPSVGTPVDTTETNIPTDEISQTETLVPIKETENPISIFTYSNNVLYFIDESGALWEKQLGTTTASLPESSQPGTPTRIGEFTVQDPNTLFSSPDGTLLLVGEGAVSTQKKFSLINPKTNNATSLPTGIKEIRFLNNAELVYYKESPGQTGIFVYTITTKKERLIKELLPQDLRLQLFDTNQLLLTEKPTNNIPNNSFLLNLTTKVLSPYFTNVLGATITPLGGGTSLAFLQNPKDEDEKQPYNLVLLNSTAQITNVLSIVTMPEKCTPDKNRIYLYCAVPMEWSKDMPNLDLPDDYYMQRTDFTEKFYRIDLITFTADEITQNPITEDAIYPRLSEDEKTLYFHNRKDGYVYSLTISPAE